MSDPNDMNAQVIKEFRANAGVVGGYFEGKPVLLLHHTGAKSGTVRVSPLMFNVDGDNFVIFASKGGAPTDPEWYRNLIAAGAGRVEVGDEAYDVAVEEITGEDRDRLFDEQARRFSGFGEYAEKTAGIRTIPVVALRRG